MTFSHSVDEKIGPSQPIYHSKSGMGRNLLIPVDFSDSSMIAVKAGLQLSEHLGLSPVILHAYPQVMLVENSYMPYLDGFDPLDQEIQSAIQERDLLKLARCGMSNFTAKVRKLQEKGEICQVKFSSVILEGGVEQVILDYCKQNNPHLVVMATRGIHQKHEELIGSVTAEVLDNCRVPVLTVPDNYNGSTDNRVRRILMFCSLDQYDSRAVEQMMDTFHSRDIEVWLMPVEGRNFKKTIAGMSQLFEEMSQRWNNAKFHIADVEKDGITPELDAVLRKEGIQMLIAPNKKKGIFTSLFRPSIAHRCLFAIDLPMLALPV